ncbi:MAG: 50S ribosomal protein L11 methyltransferase [Desulfobacterales bacterium]|nr:50S ribosomal protein L11 methyltransferase [Desulfobacterales bacterium]
MKWSEIKVIFDSTDKELAADLISNIFYDLGLSGVVLEDADMPLSPNGPGDLPLPRVNAVSAYLPKTENLPGSMDFINTKLLELARQFHIQSRIVCRDIDETDWAESWKAYFWPQKIGRKIVIKPSWREYVSHPDDIILEIDPGMAFGTGTHPTTSLCLQMIETHLQKGDAFLDVGTGSGILMAAAAKLGAERLIGIDNDVLAVEIAGKNLLLNHIDPEKFDVFAGDLAETVHEKFHFVAANILTEAIIRLLDQIRNILKDGGVFVCSGIIEENKELILSKMETLGFEILDTAVQEKWVAVAGRLRNNQAL